LYICIITNTSQCWALYCLILFYYATKNELGPIRPVGKFLSVKAVVFFTWWQSVFISSLYQMDMFPHYQAASNNSRNREWTPEDVAKGVQDYLICIEMFLAAVVHTFVFPHTEYSPQAVAARTRALNLTDPTWQPKRLGRKRFKDDASCNGSNMSAGGVELSTIDGNSVQTNGSLEANEWMHEPLAPMAPLLSSMGRDPLEQVPLTNGLDPIETWESVQEIREEDEEDEEEGSSYEDEDEVVEEQSVKPNFVRAFLDSTIPVDLRDSAVGIVKGDYHVERKTLLQHATTSDQYDLFARPFTKRKPDSPPR
jgi:hypothetical protein